MNAQKILIVEDEQIVQMHLRSIVESLGHCVVGPATTPEAAHAAAADDPPDLVLMDVRLGSGGDGIGAASELRDRHECAVLFVTAHSDPDTVNRAGAVAASGYLVKPFTSAEVAASITTALASHRRLRRAEDRERSLLSALGSSSDALLVVDRDGAVCFANPVAAELSGWSVTEACARNIHEVVRFADPADERSFRSALHGALEAAAPASLPAVVLEGRAGGEREVDVRLEPVEDDRVSPSCLLVTLRVRGPATAPAAPRRRPASFGDGTKLLVYSHDTFGLGHLRRTSNLVRALAARSPGLSTLLVTGSPVAHRFELPPGTDYVKLPAVRKVAPESYEPRFLSMSDAGIHALRSNLLLRTIRDYEPDVLLVDHSPTGMNGELLPALEWLRRQGRCTTILGLRDIIDSPDAVRRSWKQDGVYDVLRDAYDHVVVYGSQSIYDVPAEYAFPGEVAAKTRFVDYVTGASAVEGRRSGTNGSALVVVSIGGGDGGVETVVDPFVTMLEWFGTRLDVRAEIVLGPFVPAQQAQNLRSRVRGLGVGVHDFVPDPTPLFRRADLVIGTAGYNTTVELLTHAERAVLVPRVLHRQEQMIRASRLAELGLVTCIPPSAATPERLHEEVLGLRGGAPSALVAARAAGEIPLEGAEHFADFCSRLTLSGAPA